MGAMRSCYKTAGRPYGAGGPLIRIRWYFTPPGAPVYQGPHVWEPWKLDRDRFIDQEQAGEVPNAVQRYDKGGPPRHHKTERACGTEEDFAGEGTPPTLPDGRPDFWRMCGCSYRAKLAIIIRHKTRHLGSVGEIVFEGEFVEPRYGGEVVFEGVLLQGLAVLSGEVVFEGELLEGLELLHGEVVFEGEFHLSDPRQEGEVVFEGEFSPPSVVEVSCGSCTVSPRTWTLTVAGLAGEAAALNGTWLITYSSGCLWQSEVGDPGGANAQWFVQFDGTSWRVQGICSGTFFGHVGLYRPLVEFWHCTESNTVQLVTATDPEFPAEVTVDPV